MNMDSRNAIWYDLGLSLFGRKKFDGVSLTSHSVLLTSLVVGFSARFPFTELEFVFIFDVRFCRGVAGLELARVI